MGVVPWGFLEESLSGPRGILEVVPGFILMLAPGPGMGEQLEDGSRINVEEWIGSTATRCSSSSHPDDIHTTPHGPTCVNGRSPQN